MHSCMQTHIRLADMGYSCMPLLTARQHSAANGWSALGPLFCPYKKLQQRSLMKS